MKTSWTRAAIATAAVAAVTAGLVGAAAAQPNPDAAAQDNPVFENPNPSRQSLFMEALSSVNGTVDGEKGQWDVANNVLSPEEGAGGDEAMGYSIDMVTEYFPDTVYEERYWKDVSVDNLEYIQWVMENSYPSVEADVLAEEAGVGGILEDFQEPDAAMIATQAAVWNYAHDFDLDREEPSGHLDDYDEVILGIYDYLLKNSEKERQPVHGIDITGPGTVSPEDPYILDSFPDAEKITIAVDGGKAVDVNGKEIARVSSGTEFYVEPDDDASEVVIESYAETVMPVGKLYERTGEEGPEMLILAEPIQERGFANFSMPVRT